MPGDSRPPVLKLGIKDLSKPENLERKLPVVFKIDITPEEYAFIKENFKFEDLHIDLHYMYFDTDLSSRKAALRKNEIRLRVKLKKSKYFLELKRKRKKSEAGKENEDFELGDEISPEAFREMVRGNLPVGTVKDKLIKLGLFAPMQLMHTTHTTRRKIDFHHGELVIDATDYDSGKDYQIEFRSDRIFTQDKIDKIKAELGISKRQTARKR